MIVARFRALTASSKQIRTHALIRAYFDVQREWADTLIQKAQIYPPPPPESRYVRTGTLGRSWRRDGPKVQREGIVTRVTNNATDPRGRQYPQYVHGDSSGHGQALVHVGRWELLADLVDRSGYLSELRRVTRENIER